MGQLMRAIQEDNEPEISGSVTLGTLALCEAAYRSASEGKAVSPKQIFDEMVGR
jgi:predicted dehydrogenase